MKIRISLHCLIFFVLQIVGSVHGQEGRLSIAAPASIKIPPPPVVVYLTDKGEGFHGGGPGRIEIGTAEFLKSLQSSESWAAEQDPAGHWSPVVSGFQVSLRFDQTTFTNAQPIIATVLLRNVSDKDRGFSLIRHAAIPSYGLLEDNFEFVVVGPDGKQMSGKERKLVSPHHVVIGKGTQRKLTFPLNDEFKFESPGKYRVQAKTFVADPKGSNKSVAIISSEAVIEIAK